MATLCAAGADAGVPAPQEPAAAHVDAVKEVEDSDDEDMLDEEIEEHLGPDMWPQARIRGQCALDRLGVVAWTLTSR